MKTAYRFEDLVVWQKSHEFVLGVYEYTRSFPNDEKFGLTIQFRRAAVSIAANISEGFRKSGNKDTIRFFNISQGSLEECRYYLILSSDLNYGENSELILLAEEISKMLTSFIRKTKIQTDH